MTTPRPAEQSLAFIAAAREKPRTLAEIAETIGLPLDEARAILHRGVDAKRLRINDADRQNIVIEAMP